jgi:hypothetical protein
MRFIEGLLTFLIFITALYIIYLYFKRTNPHKLRWNDTPPEPFENAQQSTTPSQPKSPLATDQDYKAFFEWQTKFCNTWNKVIEQSMSTENFKGSTVDYVQNLQSKQRKTFVKCYDEITADPDPFAIQTKIPTVQLYLSTMNFMSSKISSILQKTKDALAGNPQKEEGFEDKKSCGCLSPEAAGTIQNVADIAAANAAKKAEEEQRLKKAIQQILISIKPIVKDKSTLEGQLDIINSGLNELIEYKRKAESGQLASEVKIPA